MSTGGFTEFTDYLNFVLSHTTRDGIAKSGWLAKSLFFYAKPTTPTKLRGFANGIYYDSLLDIGETLRDLYEYGAFHNLTTLTPLYLNDTVTSTITYPGHTHTQKENYEFYIKDIFTHARTLPI